MEINLCVYIVLPVYDSCRSVDCDCYQMYDDRVYIYHYNNIMCTICVHVYMYVHKINLIDKYVHKSLISMKLSLYILWRYIYIPANIHVVDYTYVYICTCKRSSTPVCSQGWSLLVFVKLVVTYLWSLSSCFLFWLVCYPLGFNNLCVCVCVCVCVPVVSLSPLSWPCLLGGWPGIPCLVPLSISCLYPYVVYMCVCVCVQLNLYNNT